MVRTMPSVIRKNCGDRRTRADPYIHQRINAQRPIYFQKRMDGRLFGDVGKRHQRIIWDSCLEMEKNLVHLISITGLALSTTTTSDFAPPPGNKALHVVHSESDLVISSSTCLPASRHQVQVSLTFFYGSAIKTYTPLFFLNQFCVHNEELYSGPRNRFCCLCATSFKPAHPNIRLNSVVFYITHSVQNL